MGRRQAGFTLVEVLVAMALLMVVVAAGSLLLSSAIRHSSDVQERILLQTEARAAVAGVVRGLRQAYTGDTTPALESIGESEITFLSPDAAEPLRVRRIAYRLAGDERQRAMAVSTNVDGPPWNMSELGPWTTLARGIVDPVVFRYQDAGGQPTTDSAAVRSVVVTLAVAARTSPRRRLTYRTTAYLRATR